MERDYFNWADELECAVTVCDTDGVVVYRNEKSAKTFEKYGELLGKNLKECHGEQSWNVIKSMLASGDSNSYTIEKGGVKKLIHQTPWREKGAIKGLVEFSIVLPGEMPHFKR
ncbi:MAG: PAS sensor protein [Bacteroidales bacterium]|jgi:transcriptional regulator with PAS, ATPase and Fis domain|nr:PAS sensor protein [Bacteroidales bacterium]